MTIHLMPPLVDAVGWRFAFVPLALGPLLEVWAMAQLHRHFDAANLAVGPR
jgi:hypothetical protein